MQNKTSRNDCWDRSGSSHNTLSGRIRVMEYVKSISNNPKSQEIVIIGKRFNRLTVVELSETVGNDGTYFWNCRCDCGRMVAIRGTCLRTGHTKSCGCLRNEKLFNRSYKHGHAHRGEISRTYNCWTDMKKRCTVKNSQNYRFYGGRGITVCDRWTNSFENFMEDMGECPEGLSLDRINPNGNYEPENCRWVSMEIQHKNTRRGIFLEHQGCLMNLSDWAKETNINYRTLLSRLHKGKSVKEILSR